MTLAVETALWPSPHIVRNAVPALYENGVAVAIVRCKMTETARGPSLRCGGNMNNEHFRDQYRIASARLVGWNYTTPGWYFVTVCTDDRVHFFGEVIETPNGEARMILSPMGEIIASELLLVQTRRPDVCIDTFVVMPNHVHILLEIRKTNKIEKKTTKKLQANSLGSIIGQWKAGVTKNIFLAGNKHFAWQDRYYDIILRYHIGMDDIRQYIHNNPKNWLIDQNKPAGVYM